jgi:hypothetical protein
MKPVIEDNIFRRQLTTQRMWPILRPSSPLRASQNEFLHTFLTPFSPDISRLPLGRLLVQLLVLR